jgi:hypothetical protein
MITGLLGWFARKETNKRVYPRKKKFYKASYLLEREDDEGAEQPERIERSAIGIDVSAGGISFLAREKIELSEFDMLMKLDGIVIHARAKVMSETPTEFEARRVYRYGMQFTGIAADEWDAVVRYTTDRPVAERGSNLTTDIARVRMSPDDAARLLPQTLQNKLLAILVQQRRLAPLDESHLPLVQYFYSGAVRQEKLLLHYLTIQSKVVGPNDEQSLFETEFLFDDAGTNLKVLASGPVEPRAAAKG